MQLRVLRTSATEQNPAVMRLNSELRAHACRAGADGIEPGRRARQRGRPAGRRIPEARVDYVRARRELKLQETMLEGMVRQYEIAKLDEAKEGPVLQQVDIALPPDHKSKPSRALIVLASTLLGPAPRLGVGRRAALPRDVRADDPAAASAWHRLVHAWSLRR